MLAGKRILLIIGGGIAACSVLAVIRLLRAEGAAITPVLTAEGACFVTPLSVATVAGAPVREALSGPDPGAPGQDADLVLVAPASADLLARMAQGAAGDPAGPMLPPGVPVLIVPAMPPAQWQDPATQRNLARLLAGGVRMAGPDTGAAWGEDGLQPAAILAAAGAALGGGALAGRHILVTSGPTHEPIDPVRYIANRSSGQQGTALAAALRDLGARVSFVTGPADTPVPLGVEVIRVETAQQMLDAVMAALPADAAVMAAAVADWRVANAGAQKMKKQAGALPVLEFAENPDILATLSRHAARPGLVVGFAAETENVIANAQAKRARKGCDWIVANDVSPATGIMGGAENAVHLVTAEGVEDWPRLPKPEVARRLAGRIAAALGHQP